MSGDMERLAEDLTHAILRFYGYTDDGIAYAESVHPGLVCGQGCFDEDGKSTHGGAYDELGATAATVIEVIMPWLAAHDQKVFAAGAAAQVISHGPGHPDTETYARIHNEGWDAAMLAQVAPDPTTADDWLAAHDAEVAARALREAADAWTQGEWSDAMLPTPLAVPVIAYANRIGVWLRARADRVAGHEGGADRG